MMRRSAPPAGLPSRRATIALGIMPTLPSDVSGHRARCRPAAGSHPASVATGSTSRGARRAATAAVLFAAAMLVASCGSGPTLPEDDLFREASLALEDESYTTAISSYKKLLEEYPFSDKAEIASLNIAYAHYLNEEYTEAIVAFNDFERMYPVSPLLPFVSYTIGMCWLDQARDGQRDPQPSDEALRQFRKVENEFPGTLYADLARFRQKQAQENLAAHEIVVGDYYRDRGRSDAAAGRYRYIVKQYPETENASRAASRLKDLEVASADRIELPAVPPEGAQPPLPSATSPAAMSIPAATVPTSTSASPASATGAPAGGDPAAKE